MPNRFLKDPNKSENDAGAPRPHWQKSTGLSNPYLSVGWQLAGAMLIYIGIGYALDRWLGTSPRYLLVGSVVGIVAFFLQLARVVKRMNLETQNRRPGQKYKEWESDDWRDDAKLDEWEEKWRE
ncbi:MAG: F0F1-type ATP synthase assembly protein I [Rhodothermales bacterium]|jgi:F0F1-type ATP synthase assembly protein I